MVYKLSDVSYVCSINSETFNSQIDLEDLLFDDKSEICNFSIDDNDERSISFYSHEDYQFTKEIYDECMHICNDVLSLNALIRDYYVSGIRSSIGNKRNLQLSHEILKQFSNSSMTDHLLLETSAPSSWKASSKILETRSNSQCFYCDISSNVDPSRKFVVHPYVPQSSKSTPIVMCLICLENWKEYRDKAEFEGELILSGQVNEEICALCADTPVELILCDTCPRSYCHVCLEKIVGREGANEIVNPSAKSSSSWKCFPCKRGFTKTPPLSKSYWVYLDGSSNVPESGRPALSSSGDSPSARPQAGSAVVSGVEDEDDEFCLEFERVRAKQKKAVDKSASKLVQPTKEDINVAKQPVKKKSDSDTVIKTKLGPAFDGVTKTVSEGKLTDTNQKVAVATDVRTIHPPTPVPSEEEAFYFSQYVKFFENLDSECSQNPSRKRETDDACFLCKDGGDLLECDWRRSKGGLKCLKCYHETCLSYSIPENQEWICMRHFCMSCGDKRVKYMCKFCSNSICAACPEKVVEKVCELIGLTFSVFFFNRHYLFKLLVCELFQYGLSRHVELKVGLHTREVPESVQSIVCQTCLDLLALCVAKGLLPPDFSYSEDQILRFPGRYDPDKAAPTYHLVVPVNVPSTRVASVSTPVESSSLLPPAITLTTDKGNSGNGMNTTSSGQEASCDDNILDAANAPPSSAPASSEDQRTVTPAAGTATVKRRVLFRLPSTVSVKKQCTEAPSQPETPEIARPERNLEPAATAQTEESSMSIADLQAFRDFLAK